MNGKVVEPLAAVIGYPTHLEIYKGFDEIGGIVHTLLHGYSVVTGRTGIALLRN